MGAGIRQTATDNYLSPTTTLDANADYTLMGWFRFASFEGVYTVPLGLSNGDATRYDSSYFYPGWRAVELVAGEGYETDGDEETPALDTWTHLALVRDGADVSLWIDGAETFTATLDVSEADPVTMLLIGGWHSDGYSVLGDMTACRAWTAALDGTEIAAEMASAEAVRSSGLWADWRMTGADESARLQDASGNGRHLTRYGDATETFSDGPEFGGAQVDLTASAAGTSTTGDVVLAVLHSLTASAAGASSTGDAALATARALAGSAAGASATGAAQVAVLRALAASATGTSSTPGITLAQMIVGLVTAAWAAARPGVSAAGSRPGVTVSAAQPGVGAVGSRPGASASGARPGVSATGRKGRE